MGVKIRINRGKLFLDIIHKGNRHWENLGLSVTADKTQMREVMRLAEIARSKRETQLFSGEWDLLDPVGGKKSLCSYLEEMGKDRGGHGNREKDMRTQRHQGYAALCEGDRCHDPAGGECASGHRS